MKIGGRKKRGADFETFETKTENVGSAESGEFDEPGRPKLNKDGVKIGLNIVVDVKQPERRNKGAKAKGFRRSPFREENEAVGEEEPVFPFGRLSLDEAERLIHFLFQVKQKRREQMFGKKIERTKKSHLILQQHILTCPKLLARPKSLHGILVYLRSW